MAEFDSGSLHIVSTKLFNLLNQVNSASSEDLSNRDVRAALSTMKENLHELINQIGDAEDYSPSLREGIIIEATEHISLYSRVLGIVIRSSTTRNPFELYFPFKEIAKGFFPDAPVYLVLSSEWDYVPFTYPLTLEELPNFILIGMPAPEADNVLAFPLAGHELGHSIWRRKGLKSNFSSLAYELTRQRFDRSPELLRSLFPGVSEEEFENDLFSSRLKDSAISQIITFCLRQTEEVFCDLVGVNIFGASYLHAFRYLLAPSASGERSYEYPDLFERVQLLDDYASQKGLPSVEVTRWFSKEDDISHPFYAALVKLADSIRREMWDQLVQSVEEIVTDAKVPEVRPSAVTAVRIRFQDKQPIETDTSLGELISGAWEYYSLSFSASVGDSKHAELAASNLVLKSAEAMEFRARMKVAS